MKKLWVVLTLILFSSAAVLAQRTIRGVVSSANGEPLIGANVLVEGTSIGAVTDIDGASLLNCLRALRRWK